MGSTYTAHYSMTMAIPNVALNVLIYQLFIRMYPSNMVGQQQEPMVSPASNILNQIKDKIAALNGKLCFYLIPSLPEETKGPEQMKSELMIELESISKGLDYILKRIV